MNRTIMASNQSFQHVLQFITKCQTHLGPHPPGRWVLWLVESHTNLMMTGLNSLAWTSNPHLLPKILFKVQMSVSSATSSGSFENLKQKSSCSALTFSPKGSIFEQKPTQWKPSTNGFWLLASLQWWRVLVLSFYSPGELWAFQGLSNETWA